MKTLQTINQKIYAGSINEFFLLTNRRNKTEQKNERKIFWRQFFPHGLKEMNVHKNMY